MAERPPRVRPKKGGGNGGGAPKGNKNAAFGRQFRNALVAVIAKRAGEYARDPSKYAITLEGICEKLLDTAMTGDVSAIRELRDTLDGRPAQQVAITDMEGGPVQHTMQHVMSRAAVEALIKAE